MELDPVQFLRLVKLDCVRSNHEKLDPVEIDPLELVPLELNPVELDQVYFYLVELNPVNFWGPV